MTSIPNIPAGSAPIPEHQLLQPSHAGTDLSSAGPGYMVNFQSEYTACMHSHSIYELDHIEPFINAISILLIFFLFPWQTIHL